MKRAYWQALGAGVGFCTVLAGVYIAQTNAPDGPGGEVTTLVRQSSGKIIRAGRFSEPRIERRLATGEIDPTFTRDWSTGGFNASVLTLAVDAQDRIVAGGEFTNFDTSIAGHILRLNSDGSLDTAFAQAIGTGFDDVVRALHVLPDGKILVAGAFTSFDGTPAPRISRLNPDGTMDSSFDPKTGYDAAVRALASSPGNKGWVADRAGP